jgi:hypothetical protein
MDFFAGMTASQKELDGATMELVAARVCVDE